MEAASKAKARGRVAYRRPSPSETAAAQHVVDMMKGTQPPILSGGRGRPPNLAVVACAMAMRRSEFEFEEEAREHFSIKAGTSVTATWEPRLAQLEAQNPAGFAVAAAAAVAKRSPPRQPRLFASAPPAASAPSPPPLSSAAAPAAAPATALAAALALRALGDTTAAAPADVAVCAPAGASSAPAPAPAPAPATPAGDGRCMGETRERGRCHLTRRSRHRQADPLRAGGTFCALHMDPDEAGPGENRCEGYHHGRRCKVTTVHDFPAAQPLHLGGRYCSQHLWQDWRPPADCADGECASALGAIDPDLVTAFELAYCEACERSWRAVGGWCSQQDADVWYAMRNATKVPNPGTWRCRFRPDGSVETYWAD
jgi:hypothetical protein